MSSEDARVILGIHGRTSGKDRVGVHDAGAALVVDGTLVAAVNEERLSRIKNHTGFPHQSIEEVLKLGGVSTEQVDLVAMAALDLPQLGTRVCRSQFSTLLQAGTLAPRRLAGAARDALLRRHRQAPPWAAAAQVRFVEHHQAHVASAYYTCPWPQATVVTVDGTGDELCATVSRARDGQIERLWSCSGYHSPGLLYSAITYGLGWKKNRHEVKVTGLAAYGDADRHLDEFRRLLRYDSARRRFVAPEVARLYRDLDGITPTLERLCSGDEPAHVAAAMQSVTEEVITALCADAVTATGIPNLALAGGIFANVKLNQRLLDLDVVDDVYVHPNMGDGGLAAGAALQVAADERPADERLLPSFRSDVYLGPEYTDDEVGAVLQSQGRSFTECDDIEDRVGQLLSEGTVVARHAGRMEYGPRALGNRSLLVQPTDPTVNDWLNARLERTEFMPFAPATLEEHAADFFLGWRPEQVAARFMTITYDTAKSARDQAPATVHVDDTARPQIVRHQDNPSYHRIIDAYRERTGIPSIINTSFNMHEEPIVCTPEDALRALDQGSADVLAINRFLVYPPSG